MPEPTYVPSSPEEIFWFQVAVQQSYIFELALIEYPSPALLFVADALESMGDDRLENNK